MNSSGDTPACLEIPLEVPLGVAFVDALPRNATGKVLKRELRVPFAGG